MPASIPKRGTPEYRWWLAGAEAEAAARKEGRSKAGLAVLDLVDAFAEHWHDMTEADIARQAHYVFVGNPTDDPTSRNGSAMTDSTSPVGLPPLGTIEQNAKTFARDLAERVLSSALGGFVAGLVVTEPLNGSMWYTAATAGVAAGVSVVKGLIAKLTGDKDSASLAKGV